MDQQQRRRWLIGALLQERTDQPRLQAMPIPAGEAEQKQLLRALFNIRPPMPASQEFLAMQDAYLQQETRRKGVTDLPDLAPVQPGLYLWQGGHHHAAVRRHRKCRQQPDAGLFLSQPRLHRQCHPHLCRGAAAAGVRPPDGAPGP